MQNVAATDQIKGQLHRAIDEMRDDFARIELLAAALEVFSQPVPDYEPKFHHLHRTSLNAHELREPRSRKADH